MNGPMSWQARILMIIMRVQRFLTTSSTKLDVARDRADNEAFAKTFKPIAPVEMQRLEANSVPAAWFIPAGIVNERVILYAHGGSYNAGSITSHIPLTGNIASVTRSRLLSLDYRLAPEHPFPAAVEDALSAYRWLLAQNINPRRIVVAGDSAGGGLMLALLLAARDQGLPLPAAAVGLSAWTDLTCSGETWTKNEKVDFMIRRLPTLESAKIYLGDVDPKTQLASPLFGNLQGLPPILLQAGSNEVILSDSVVFAEKARAAGVDVQLEVWRNMQHEWQYAAKLLPEGHQALEHIRDFLEAKCPA